LNVSNPPLTITFLGTGTSTGVPMIACPCEVCASTDPKDKRLRSSILVRSSTTTLVVDTTPDFRSQMLRENVRRLDAVLFTHPHKDHLAGLDDIRAFNYFQQGPIDVYANEITELAIVHEFPYVFADVRYPGIPEVRLKRIEEEPFIVGDIPVTPIQVWHMNMRVLGFRFGRFTYITDANRIEETEKAKIRGTEQLVLNALRHEKHMSHYSLQEAIEEARELKVRAAWFTHISHQLGKHAKINLSLPEGMELAYDRLVVTVPGG
jgi:phosphoribosyl 1,2-cyclic phosphate phosphodiesterase